MNAIDMWLASTFDLPWSANGQTPQGAATTATSSEGTEKLDIELLSELINAQDATSNSEPAGTTWSQNNADNLWTSAPTTVEQISALSDAGFLETADWLSSVEPQKPVKTEVPASDDQSALFDSLTDLSAIGSLSINSVGSSPASDTEEISSLKSEVSETDEVGSAKRPAPRTARAGSDSSRKSPASVMMSGDEEDDVPLKKKRKTPRRQPPKDSLAYRRRREQNNQAVRRCRQKTKERNDENQRVADDLREENDQLKQRLGSLFREVRSLRAMLGLRTTDEEIASLSSSQITSSGTSCSESTNNSLWQGLGANFVF